MCYMVLSRGLQGDNTEMLCDSQGGFVTCKTRFFGLSTKCAKICFFMFCFFSDFSTS